MTNEILFLLMSLASLMVVSVSALFGRMWLYVTTVVLILVTVAVAGKLTLVFGFTTMPGVSTFAGIFLATDILAEFYGKKAAKRAIWLTFFANVVFTGFGYVSSLFVGEINPAMDTAVETIFQFLPRLVAGSLISFIIAQNFDVIFFHFLKRITNNKHLWLRNNLSTVTSQLLDSTLFVLIAFGPETSGVWDIIVSIWVLKSAVALADTPFIYFVSYMLKKYPSLRDWDKRLLDADEGTYPLPHGS